ncbi:MAG: hypothetical protein DWC10_05705, partial [Candidatus Poseidoniales archaeon]
RITASTSTGEELFLHEEQLYANGKGIEDTGIFNDEELRVWRMNSLDPYENYFDTISDWNSENEVLVWCSTPLPIEDRNGEWMINHYPTALLIDRPDLYTTSLLSIVSPEAAIRPDLGFYSAIDLGLSIKNAQQTQANLNAEPTGVPVFDALRASSFHCMGWTTVQNKDPSTWLLDGLTTYDEEGVNAMLNRADEESLMVLPWYGQDVFLSGAFNTGSCSSRQMSSAFLRIVTPESGADWHAQCGNDVYGQEFCVSAIQHTFYIGGAYICERFHFDEGFSDRSWFHGMVEHHRTALLTGDLASVILWTAATVFDIATGPFVPVVGLLKLGVFIGIKGTKYTTKIAYQAIDSVTESIAKESQSLMELQTYKILDGLRDGGDIRTQIGQSEADRIAITVAKLHTKIHQMATQDVAKGHAEGVVAQINELYLQMCLSKGSQTTQLPPHCTGTNGKFLFDDDAFIKDVLNARKHDEGNLKGFVGELVAAEAFLLRESCFSECIKSMQGSFAKGPPDFILTGTQAKVLAGLNGKRLSTGKAFHGHVKNVNHLDGGGLNENLRYGLVESAERGNAASLICTNPRSFDECEGVMWELALNSPELSGLYSVTKIDETGQVWMKWFTHSETTGISPTEWRAVDLDPMGTVSLKFNDGLGRSGTLADSFLIDCSCSEQEEQLYLLSSENTQFFDFSWGFGYVHHDTITIVAPSLYSTIRITFFDSEDNILQSSAEHLDETGETVAEYLLDSEELTLTTGQEECIVGSGNSICVLVDASTELPEETEERRIVQTFDDVLDQDPHAENGVNELEISEDTPNDAVEANAQIFPGALILGLIIALFASLGTVAYKRNSHWFAYKLRHGRSAYRKQYSPKKTEKCGNCQALVPLDSHCCVECFVWFGAD